jgi:hypothetical protein
MCGFHWEVFESKDTQTVSRSRILLFLLPWSVSGKAPDSQKSTGHQLKDIAQVAAPTLSSRLSFGKKKKRF